MRRPPKSTCRWIPAAGVPGSGGRAAEGGGACVRLGCWGPAAAPAAPTRLDALPQRGRPLLASNGRDGAQHAPAAGARGSPGAQGPRGRGGGRFSRWRSRAHLYLVLPAVCSCSRTFAVSSGMVQICGAPGERGRERGRAAPSSLLPGRSRPLRVHLCDGRRDGAGHKCLVQRQLRAARRGRHLVV
jgi:hypothetical protein